MWGGRKTYERRQRKMKDRVEMSKVYYRVYKHRGETIVSRGTINEYGNFEPFNGSSPWMTGNPMYLMTLENGKVLCENERDIPKAIKMVEEGSAKVEKEVKSNTKCPSIEELEQRTTIYEFATTETEFNVIKHALARLQAQLNWRLDREWNRNGQALSFEERNAMIIERSATSELIQKMLMVDMKGD